MVPIIGFELMTYRLQGVPQGISQNILGLMFLYESLL
jgi:hypothetical protein